MDNLLASPHIRHTVVVAAHSLLSLGVVGIDHRDVGVGEGSLDPGSVVEEGHLDPGVVVLDLYPAYLYRIFKDFVNN